MKADAMDPSSQITAIVSFIRHTYKAAGRTTGIIATSGGIDSALSQTLLCQAIGSDNVHAVLLPYGDQSITDSQTICQWNTIPADNIHIHNIQPMVQTICNELGITDSLRMGNIMARVRMIVVYDLAKKRNALVCGTENKSEHYLGYFTRFGDSASDIEPLCYLYKTQVRQLAQTLGIPNQFLNKPPSAGLWDNQTDENELGFTYEHADMVIAEYLGETEKHEQISDNIRQKILKHIKSQEFKREVPYVPS